MIYIKYLKTPLDSIVSLVMVILLLPLFIMLITILYISFRESPFFIQQRVGMDEKVFKILKFKTMDSKKDASGNLLPDHIRLTPIGKFVRKTSLDEIPQLLNVIKGDMSIVGPRPLLPEYLKLYSKEQARRHEVNPGITGWVQVNGRNAISWEEKFKLDVWYVEHQSFLLDLKIIFKTFKKVFASEGISQKGQATTTAFKGSSNE